MEARVASSSSQFRESKLAAQRTQILFLWFLYFYVQLSRQTKAFTLNPLNSSTRHIYYKRNVNIVDHLKRRNGGERSPILLLFLNGMGNGYDLTFNKHFWSCSNTDFSAEIL